MNSQKFILGGIVGGILFFFLGYLVYGLALKSFFDDNGMAVDMNKMEWWALIAGNLAQGFLLAYILGKANANAPGNGAATGLIVGLLMTLSFGLVMYAIGKSPTLKAVVADVCVRAVMTAIVGAAIGWVYGMRKAVATA